MTWAVVRVRGSIHARHDIVATLQELRLYRPNHAVILPETPSYKGMIDKVQGYVTWGAVSEETVAILVEKRGITPKGTAHHGKEPEGNGKGIGKATSFLFRLGAPRGGWRSTKKPFTLGGALGFRPSDAKDEMNALLRRMV